MQEHPVSVSCDPEVDVWSKHGRTSENQPDAPLARWLAHLTLFVERNGRVVLSTSRYKRVQLLQAVCESITATSYFSATKTHKGKHCFIFMRLI